MYVLLLLLLLLLLLVFQQKFTFNHSVTYKFQSLKVNERILRIWVTGLHYRPSWCLVVHILYSLDINH